MREVVTVQRRDLRAGNPGGEGASGEGKSLQSQGRQELNWGWAPLGLALTKVVWGWEKFTVQNRGSSEEGWAAPFPCAPCWPWHSTERPRATHSLARSS